MSRLRTDALDEAVLELQQARAETLFRITRRLETHLAAAQRLAKQARVADPPARRALVERFNVARAAAREYRYYLRVQREVLRLDTRGLEERYPIPPALVE